MVGGWNFGNIVFSLISFGMLIIPILITVFVIIYIVRLIRRMEKRAEERLQLDKENTAVQQQHMKAINELNQRIKNIEDTLKTVE